MRLPQTLIAFLLCICTSSFSQTIIVGKVLERGSTAPIPYVNVMIVGTTVGTATDESGKFTLRIDENNSQREIRFSSIGYISSTHQIDSLLARREEIIIELAAEVTLLGEVSIDGLKLIPRDIISHAVQSIPKNYNQKAFNAEYYSRIVTQNPTNGARYNLESVLFGYYEGYGEKQKRKFKILQKREAGENPIGGHLYWPSHELFQADLLSQPEQNGIFALKHIDKFQLTLEDVTLYDNDTVQVIEKGDYRLRDCSRSIQWETIHYNRGSNCKAHRECATFSLRYYLQKDRRTLLSLPDQRQSRIQKGFSN
jgi:hypothetical protein